MGFYRVLGFIFGTSTSSTFISISGTRISDVGSSITITSFTSILLVLVPLLVLVILLLLVLVLLLTIYDPQSPARLFPSSANSFEMSLAFFRYSLCSLFVFLFVCLFFWFVCLLVCLLASWLVRLFVSWRHSAS